MNFLSAVFQSPYPIDSATYVKLLLMLKSFTWQGAQPLSLQMCGVLLDPFLIAWVRGRLLFLTHVEAPPCRRIR